MAEGQRHLGRPLFWASPWTLASRSNSSATSLCDVPVTVAAIAGLKQDSPVAWTWSFLNLRPAWMRSWDCSSARLPARARLDELGKGNLLCGIEAYSQGCFGGLEAAGSSTREVLVGCSSHPQTTDATASRAATPSGICGDRGHFSVRAWSTSTVIGGGWPCSSMSPAKMRDRLSGGRSGIKCPRRAIDHSVVRRGPSAMLAFDLPLEWSTHGPKDTDVLH